MKYSDIKHIGNKHERTQCIITEKIFADEWEELNERIIGNSNGCGALELLLNTQTMILNRCGPDYCDKITQRDAFVAATVIQWLGTGIGKCFLENCERKIKKAKEIEQQEFHKKHHKK